MPIETHQILSSGNIQKDLENLDRFVTNTKLIEKGLCPNGCGPMFTTYETISSSSECKSCGFVYERRVVDPTFFS